MLYLLVLLHTSLVKFLCQAAARRFHLQTSPDTTPMSLVAFLFLKFSNFSGLISVPQWKNFVPFPSSLLFSSLATRTHMSEAGIFFSNFHPLSFSFHFRSLAMGISGLVRAELGFIVTYLAVKWWEASMIFIVSLRV
jgi:hypothetical protein